MMPNFIMRIFKSAVFYALLTGTILAVVIWFFGPFLAFGEWRPLDTVLQRAIAIGCVFAFLFLILLIRFFVRRRREKKLTKEIVEADPDDDVDAGDELVLGEVQELKGKLRDALAVLRKSKFGRRSIYELPWYVMIGPPGAGKTTAIVNSGLQFPLAEEAGGSSIRGVGGTRNCDWWFTEDAVLIDTAGRYTLQDSDQEADSGAWLGFLGLLKKHRRRQPINGAIVAISLSDLSLQDETTQAEHARAVRRRLTELREQLGVKFPVYVLFTKSDLVAGFMEFFEPLGKEGRAQVWGFTFDRKKKIKKDAPAIPGFDEGFAGLLSQLNAQSLERMQVEIDPQRRALISGFPSQFATLRQVAKDFLSETFQTTRYEDRHMLRGVYFTSGTQEGTPIDRLMMSMAKTFGIGRQAIGTGRGTGRSFFLRRLFEDVIFRESGLVSADDKVERRYRIVKWSAVAASVIVAATVGTLWTLSFLRNGNMIAGVAEAAAGYQQASDAIPGNPVDDADVVSVVPALNVLRDQPLNPTLSAPVAPDGTGYGLYQGKVLGNQIALTYRAALNQHFLPRLLIRLEEAMQDNINSPGELYDALKIYMLLGNLGVDDTGYDFVRDWMIRDWESSYRGASRVLLREDLTSHLDALLSAPRTPPELNGDLIERVQEILAELPLAVRVYSGILKGPEATQLQEWRLSEVGGADIEEVIVRANGKSLSDGIPGVYTYAGFNEVFLPKTLAVARQVQRENWVLGKFGEEEFSDNQLALLARDVLNLYYDDYVAAYSDILDEIDIIPLENAQHAVDVTFTLSGATSPIEKIFEAIASETRLTEDRSVIDRENVGEDLTELAQAEARIALDFRSRFILEQIINLESESGQEQRAPGQFVEDRFAFLHRLVDPPKEGEQARLDRVIDLIRDVNEELTDVLAASGSFNQNVPDQDGAIRRLQIETASLEGPLKRWSDQIAEGASGITSEGTRGSLNARWQGRILQQCRDATQDRFPFSPKSRADIPISAFTKLFGPGGDIESFFAENLARYVDTRSRPWRFRPEANLGISEEVLAQFEFADQIKRSFFANGSTPSVALQIRPFAAGDQVREVVLTIDGQEIRYERGKGTDPFGFSWPGPAGGARIELLPRSSNSESTITRDGPWALYRLLRTAQIRAVPGTDELQVTFKVGGRFAVFRLRADAILNPLTLPALTKFSCPSSL